MAQKPNPWGMAAGLAIGAALSVALESLAIGMGLGVVFGAALSLSLGGYGHNKPDKKNENGNSKDGGVPEGE